MNQSSQVGFLSATSLVVASMIGAGVYTTSGFAMADLGTPGRVMAAWLIGGIVAICGAICYGSLAHRFCESGGEYLFLSRTIHPAAGLMAGCVSLLAGFTGATAFAATALEAYVVSPDDLPTWLPPGAIAATVVLLCTSIHLYRVGPGANFQNLLVAIKLGMLLLLIAVALSKLPDGWKGLAMPLAENIRPFSLSDFATSLMWISLSYSGFNAAVYIAGEVRDGEKIVPKALFWGTLLVVVLYLALNAVFLFGPEPSRIVGQADVAVIAADAVGGAWFARLVRVVIVVSLLTSVSAMMMSGPRVYAKMAEDGLFPQWFRMGDQGPRAAIGLQAMLILLVLSISNLQGLLSYLGFTLSVSAALTVATIFPLRWREGAAAMPMPAYPLPPLVFVGGTLLAAAMAAMNRPWECAVGAATLLCGGLYWLIPRQEQKR